MATQTSGDLQLSKPAASDLVKNFRTPYNSNMDTIDTAVTALNSNKTDYISVDASSYGRFEKSGWDYAYSQLPNSYKGTAHLMFSSNYRIVCLAQKYSATYGSIIGVSNDDENPFYYGVKNGYTSLDNLALNSKFADIATNASLNNYKESGSHYCNGVTDSPTGATLNWGTVEVIAREDKTYVRQFWYPVGNDYVYAREYRNSAWGNWTKIV